MNSTTDVQTLQDSLKSALLATTRTTTEVCAEDLAFHRSLDPSIASTLDAHNARLLSLAERLLRSGAQSTDVVGPKLQDSDALETNWRGVVDVVDSLLERVDTTLDEVKGIVKRGLDNAPHTTNVTTGKKGFPKAMNLLKPQRNFHVVPTNDDTGPFKPLLTSKPHAKLPLSESLVLEQDSTYRHPYRTEIENYKYPTSVYLQTEPIPYQPFESTTAILVDTPELLAEMLEELKKAKEIAIDLEHHDMRTYVGIVSLMQISTRNQDWIVDTLKPWRRKLECLNEVFTDPSILKVFHGSGMDMIWLQRDFGLYVVGLFDTEPAARALRYPRASLAFLLEKHVKFQAQKQHQLADWRIRPLSQELFDYARSDTHFLLYIYDCMRNELIQSSNLSVLSDGDLLQKVLEGSKTYQLQRYQVPLYDAAQGFGQIGWYKMLLKTPVLFSREQFSVFKALHQWRDNVAREDDESIHFVMSNHALLSFAREMPVQREKFMSAASQITASMRNRQDEIVKLIAQAKEAGKTGPEMRDVLKTLDDIVAAQRKQRWASQSAKPTVIGPMTTKRFSPAPIAIANPTIIAKRPAVRVGESKFWGETLGSQIQQRPLHEDVRLALPLPNLTAEVFADKASSFAPGTPIAQTPTSSARPEHAFVPAVIRPKIEDDDVFIIKDLGGKGKKRKLDEKDETNDDDFGTQQDSLSLSTEEISAKEQRKLAKAAKKAKRAERAEEAEEEEEEAFDYANAPSVLNAQAELQKMKKGRKTRSNRGMDPYAKSMDAPKGLPRAQKEKAGRTATFRPRE
ncbi:hypothetical protein EG328_008240 [Venturia inaequalis]|uniref:HRDC domain-containing protein n=1 Tax=Venturia inaequalis TaxID=5025 RepID=A0A8H3VBV5_VENIN|nr:hypothetical protein EG328_008240 [Venturia inaequalis]